MFETTCQYLRGIIEGSHDLIAALDSNFKFTTFNRAYCQEFEDIFGTKIEVGMSLVDALAHLPQEQAKAMEIWGRALQGEEFTVIKEFGDENRARNYYEIAYSSIRNDRDELIGACHIIRDATTRIQVEREVQQLQENLEQQLAQLEAIYATAPSGLCFIDTNFRYVRMNDRLAEINGMPASEHIGKSVREVLPELADTLEPLYRSVIETGRPILNYKIQGLTPAQREVERNWLLSYYPLKDANGGILGINAVVHEITELKQAEEKLRSQAEIIDQIHDSVISTNLDSRITSWNQGAERIFGYSATEAMGQHVSLLFESPPDILISDLGMPEMDGYQLIREVRQLTDTHIRRIPAVALTAYAGEMDRQQVLAAGFNRHIAKPVDTDELIWTVTELIRGKG